MRLRRIEARRYGRLSDAVLGPLGDGLTVVFGPNEAGKSTYTSLVRHVLFGFPDKRVKERRYETPGGDNRVGALVFEDAAGEHSLARVEGKAGGTATLVGPGGPEDAQALLGQLVHRVTPEMYRNVFGFGLEELAELSTLDAIRERLASTSLGGVRPHDVLADLATQADALWLSRGKRRINGLLGEMTEKRKELRELQRRADDYRAERERLDALSERVDELQTALDEARLRARTLAALRERATGVERRLAEDAEQLEQRAAERDRLGAEAAALRPDEALLASGAVLDELEAGLSGYERDLTALRDAERERALAEARLNEALGALGPGWDVPRVLATPVDLSVGAELKEQARALAAAEEETRIQRRRADELAASARRAAEAAGAVIAEAGLPPDPSMRGVAADRLHAVDALLASPDATPASAPRPVAVPLAAALLGVAVGVTGVAVQTPLLFLAAALFIALAAAAWLLQPKTPARVAADSSAHVRTLGLSSVPEPATLVRLRDGIGRALRAADDADRARQEAEAARALADGVMCGVTDAEAAWRGWLDAHALAGVGGRPDDVEALLGQVRDAARGAQELRRADDLTKSIRARVAAFAGRAREAAGVDASADGVPALLRTRVQALEEARELAERAKQLGTRTEALASEIARLEERREAARAELAAALSEAALPGTTLADLAAAADVAAANAEDADAEHRSALGEKRQLEGELRIGDDETSGARLRLDQAALTERLTDDVNAYLTLRLAERLTADTLAVYERERQPAVVKRAEDLFERLTGGRYTSLVTPLGRFEPRVGGDGAGDKEHAVLSRGTAEQLYLALRLAYLENLGDVACDLPVLMDDVLVDFDDERRPLAAAVIADFAKRRQVVFFTCHQATVAAFADAAPDAARIDLGRC